MADRSIRVTLKANVADFNAQIRSGSKSLEELAAKGDKTGKVAQTSLGKLAQSAQLQQQAWSTVSNGMLMVGGAGLAAVGAAVKVFADFDEAMSTVQADTHESAANMELLRAAAVQMGADTQFSATEAAQGIDELAKAGVSTKDILGGGLAGALSLAAAGGLSVSEAAETAATALTIFKLQGKDVGHVADLLAAGAGKAQGGVSDLGMALKQSGLVASQTGLSIEETTGGLTAFAAAGLLSSDAGTSFKSMLQRLTPQSAEAQKKMDELGISAYDAQGNFIGLSQFAGNLHDSLKDLTVEQRNSAMATIFGSDAVRAANVLYTEGEQGIQGWIDAVDDSGYAAETAAAKTDNLKGDLERLGGSFETVFIQSGSGANDVLRGLVQGLEDLVDRVGRLPEPVLNVGLGLTALGAGGMVVVGMAMKVIPQLVEMKTAMLDLNMISVTGAASLGKYAGALGKLAGKAALVYAAGQAIGFMVDKIQDLPDSKGLEDTTAALISLSDADLDNLFQFDTWDTDSIDSMGQALHRLLSDDFSERANRLGSSFTGIFGAGGPIGKARDQFDELDQAMAQLVSGGHADEADAAFRKIQDAAAAQGVDVEKVTDLFPEYAAAQQDAANAAELGADAQDGATDAYTAGTGAIDEQSDALHDLIDALNEAAGINMTVDEAQAAWAQQVMDNDQAIQSLTDHVDENGNAIAGLGQASADGGQSWDLYSKAGQMASQTMLDNSQKAWDLISALDAQGASEEDLQGSMQASRDEFIRVATQMGLTQGAAEALADSYGLIPSNVHTDVEASDNATGTIARIKQQLIELPSHKTITVETVQIGRVGVGMAASTYAVGGAVSGPGTATSDSILARLSNGEHVLTARDVKAMGGQSGVYAFRRMLQQMPGYVGGGPVGGGPVGRVPASMLAPSVSVAGPVFPSDGWSISGSLDVGGQLVPLIDARITRNDRAMAGWR